MSLIGVVIAIAILVWATFGLIAIDQPASKANWLKERIDEPHEAAIAFGVVGVAVAVLGFFYVHVWHKTDDSLLKELINDFYGNVALTCVGITFTVLIIDRLNKRNAQNEEKRRIIKQMSSHSNDFAKEAIRLARENHWLSDGSLTGTILAYANLEETHLEFTNLKKAYLWCANLKNANLRSAILTEAFLRFANFENAHLVESHLGGADLRGANLRGANLMMAYLVEANLVESNLEMADLRGANLKDSYLLAAKYDRNTLWPSGFDPKAAGAILVDD